MVEFPQSEHNTIGISGLEVVLEFLSKVRSEVLRLGIQPTVVRSMTWYAAELTVAFLLGLKSLLRSLRVMLSDIDRFDHLQAGQKPRSDSCSGGINRTINWIRCTDHFFALVSPVAPR